MLTDKCCGGLLRQTARE